VTGGGYESAELFDPATGTFTPTGSMSSPRLTHTATLLNDGTVLVAGGVNDVAAKVTFATAELFDPVTGSFQPTGNMETSRSEHSATLLLNGTVLLAGGINSQNIAGLNSLSSAELFQ